MSIQDALTILSDGQALTETADSENTVDFGAGMNAFGEALAKPELAQGRPLYLNVCVGTELDSAGEAATLTITLKTSSDDSDFTTVASTGAIAEASCTAGAVLLSMALPLGLSRYNKLTYTVGTENFTSGTVNAWIGLEPIVTP